MSASCFVFLVNSFKCLNAILLILPMFCWYKIDVFEKKKIHKWSKFLLLFGGWIRLYFIATVLCTKTKDLRFDNLLSLLHHIILQKKKTEKSYCLIYSQKSISYHNIKINNISPFSFSLVSQSVKVNRAFGFGKWWHCHLYDSVFFSFGSIPLLESFFFFFSHYF